MSAAYSISPPHPEHDPSPPPLGYELEDLAKPKHRASAGNWTLASMVGRQQSFGLSNCSTKTLRSSLRLSLFLLRQNSNLLCDGFGFFRCLCGFTSHDRCRSACPLIVSCDATSGGLRLFQQYQWKAKVQWSGPAPEEIWRSGLALRRNKIFAQPYKRNEWSPSFFQMGVKNTLLSCFHLCNITSWWSRRSVPHCVALFCGSSSALCPQCGNRGLDPSWSCINYCWPGRRSILLWWLW